jgi:hypothetical protein
MSGFWVRTTCSRSNTFVISGEPILYPGTPSRSRKSTLCVSHGVQRNVIPRCSQYRFQLDEFAIRQLEFDENGHEVLERLFTQSRLFQDRFLVDLTQFSFLELDCVGACLDGSVD